ncbi:hypothetical protein V6N13_070017 [Hibiscus sabdariffa]
MVKYKGQDLGDSPGVTQFAVVPRSRLSPRYTYRDVDDNKGERESALLLDLETGKEAGETLCRVTFFVEKPRRSSKVFKVVKEARWKNGCGTKDYVSLRKIWGSSSLSLSCGLIFPVTYRLYAIVDNTRGDEFCFSNPLGYGKGSVTFMFKWILSEVALKGGGTIRSEVDKVPIDGMFTPRISTVKVSIEAENLMVVVIFESVASPQPRLPILLVLRLRALRILVVLQGKKRWSFDREIAPLLFFPSFNYVSPESSNTGDPSYVVHGSSNLLLIADDSLSDHPQNR